MRELSKTDRDRIVLSAQMGLERINLKIACQSFVTAYELGKEIFPEQLLN